MKEQNQEGSERECVLKYSWVHLNSN